MSKAQDQYPPGTVKASRRRLIDEALEALEKKNVDNTEILKKALHTGSSSTVRAEQGDTCEPSHVGEVKRCMFRPRLTNKQCILMEQVTVQFYTGDLINWCLCSTPYIPLLDYCIQYRHRVSLQVQQSNPNPFLSRTRNLRSPSLIPKRHIPKRSPLIPCSCLEALDSSLFL